jgi:putative transcriptional regulator
MESLEGQLLIASPQLLDPNFVKSVLLMIQHNQEGAFGLVLNRPVGKTVQELWREVGSAPCNSTQPIYLGGPVPGPLMSLHAKPDLAEMEPVPGVFFAAKKHHLDALVLHDDPTCKVFIGHAGWGSGQLESEIDQGAWRTLPATAERVFSTQDDLWELVLRQIGQAVLQDILHIKDVPPDPSVN